MINDSTLNIPQLNISQVDTDEEKISLQSLFLSFLTTRWCEKKQFISSAPFLKSAEAL